MSRLSDISVSPVLREFAQGAAQNAIMPVADFLAPTIEVPTSVGRFKRYTEKHRFHIPNTLRSVGGRAAELRFEAEDETYNCEPHALDYPVDNLEKLESADLENALREGAVAVAEVAALAHEKAVIDAALAATGAGTGKTWDSSADPVADVDAAILDVIKTAKYGSLMGVGVLFGASAWVVFKNAAAVRGRFVVGNGRAGGSLAVPTESTASNLFVGTPEVRTSYMVYDDAKPGLADDLVPLAILRHVLSGIHCWLAADMDVTPIEAYREAGEQSEIYLRRLLIDLRSGNNRFAATGGGTPRYSGGRAASTPADGAGTVPAEGGSGPISYGIY